VIIASSAWHVPETKETILKYGLSGQDKKALGVTVLSFCYIFMPPGALKSQPKQL